MSIVRYVKGGKVATIELKKKRVEIWEGTAANRGPRSEMCLAGTEAEAKEWHASHIAERVAKGWKLVEEGKKPVAAAGKRYFECEEDGSSKFWEVWTEGKVMKTRFGKIGASGQIKLKEFGDAKAATAELAKLVQEKTKKGYVEAGGGGSAATDAVSAKAPKQSAKVAKPAKIAEKRNPELEAAIVNDPYDRNAWMVLADWYQSEGDPRGELMALQIGNKTKPAQKVLDANLDYFLGPLAEHRKCYDSYDKDTAADAFQWRNGFIFKVRLSHNHYANEEWKGKLAKDVLGPLLDHPSGRFLVEMAFQDNDDPNDDNLQDLIDLLAKKAPKTIRRLEFGDEVDQISWYNIGNLGKLWKAVPNLRTLHMEAGSWTLGKIEAPNLKEAIFKTGGLSAESGKAIATASWPKLETLHVYYGNDEYGGDCSIKQVQPLLDRTDLGSLKYLGLMNAEFTDDLCKVLGKAKVIKGIETLDLSMGCMTGEGAAALAASADAFKHLKEIKVEENYIGDAGQAALKKAFGKRVTGLNNQQGDEDEEYRSVAVGE